ncbi:MAG: MATE family efflux transporter [Clostridium sp.]|nr:MATE family efflux transporter [Clostridium sp.]
MSIKSVFGGNVDLLNGKIYKSLVLFALPLIASGVLQQSFVAVDVAVVGRFAGKEALAAVGSNSMVINLLLNLFMGIAVGSNIVIANYLGQRNSRSASSAVATAASTSIVSGVVLLLLGVMLTGPILRAMSTPAEIVGQATTYLRIYFLGMPFLMVYNFGAAILRSIGDTRRPFVMLLFSGAVNVVLNLLLVVGFGMGVAGVAWATVAANGVNALLMMRLLAREKGECHVDWRHLSLSRTELGKMMRIGVPTGLQGMVFSIANIFVQTCLNGFGADAVAGSAAALNFEYYCYFAINSFAQGCVAFVSCNYGASNFARCRRTVSAAMVLSVCLSGFLNVGLTLMGADAVGIFIDHPDVVRFAEIRMTHVLLFQFIACSYEITGAALRGLGNAMTPTLITIAGTCVVRLGWVFLVVPFHHTLATLYVVYPLTWVMTGIAMVLAWRHISRRKLPVLKNNLVKE